MKATCRKQRERRKSYKIFVEKGHGRSRREDNIKTDAKETGCESVERIEEAQDRVD
jgi:hypothetical protein